MEAFWDGMMQFLALMWDGIVYSLDTLVSGETIGTRALLALVVAVFSLAAGAWLSGLGIKETDQILTEEERG
jgi:hypothetical protein